MDKKTEELDKISTEFNSTLMKLLNLYKRLDPKNVDLEFLQNKIKIAREIDPLCIIKEAAEPLWRYKDQILEQKEDFFMKHDFSEDKSKVTDVDQGTIDHFIKMFKTKFLTLSGEEKEIIWKNCKILLGCAVKYKKVNTLQ